MKHFAAKGATDVDEAGKLIYAALLKVHTHTNFTGPLNVNMCEIITWILTN